LTLASLSAAFVAAPSAAAASPMAIDMLVFAQPEQDDDSAAAGGAAAPPTEGQPDGGQPAEGGDAAAPSGDATPAPEGGDAAEQPDTGPPPVVGPDPNAAQPEGPPPDGQDPEYATSKDAGQAMSGREGEKDDLPVATETVGEEKVKPKNLSHIKTGQIGAAIGLGYNLVTGGDKYCGEFTDDPTDKDARKSICTGRTPVALDVMLAFGAADRIDIVVGARINLEKRDYDSGPCKGDVTCVDGKGLFANKRAIGVMPGVRLWGKGTNQVFKLGGAVDILYLFENFDGYRNRPALNDTNKNVMEDDGMPDDANRKAESKVSNHILGIRGGPVIQIDPHHNIGIFFIPAAVPTFRPAQAGSSNSGWFEIAFEASLGVQARFP
jgi:hypothetical protein